MSASGWVVPAVAVAVATGMVTWLWLTIATMARNLRTVGVLEGMHLEI